MKSITRVFVANRAEDLKERYGEASAEALSAFGDGRIYMEHLIPNARHIEIQMLADKYGKIIHLFERDCSLQRRYQKVIAEALSPAVSDDLRNRIDIAATRIASHIRYALANFYVEGLETNIPFLSKIVHEPDFTNGKTNTRWLENMLLRV